ncbi:MAG: hypothetical protein MI748_19850, partial [Opitutales bacterium]|nr:hypothetical protein [Opitutales bacterium]
MKSNLIPQRIADTLKKFPPFSLLEESNLLSISNEALVRVFVKGDTLWEQGDSPGDRIRFLARGRVEYYWKNED